MNTSNSTSSRIRSALFLALLTIIATGAQATATIPTGSGLDKTFGDHGVAVFRGVAGKNTAVEICEPAANGRVLVGGIGSNRALGDGIDPGGGNVWLGWLTSSGSRAREFGRNGVLTKLPVRGARLRHVVPDARGRTLAIVSRKFGKRTFASIMRLTPTGKLDPSFNKDGRTGLGRMTSKSTYTLLPAGEKTYLHIKHREGSVLLRYLDDGTLDPQFIGIRFYPPFLEMTGATPLADGGVIVFGRQPIGDGRNRAVITKIRADASLDTSWGTGGSHFVEATPPSVAVDLNPTAPPSEIIDDLGSVYVQDVAEMSDHRVAVRLESSMRSGYRYPIWAQRLNANGTPDATFGTAGSLGLTFGSIVFDDGGGDYAWSWNQFAPDGRIYFGYYGEFDGAPSFGVSRRTTNGAADPSFAPSFSLGRSDSWIQDVRLDTLGRRVIACGFTARQRPYRATGYVFALATGG